MTTHTSPSHSSPVSSTESTVPSDDAAAPIAMTGATGFLGRRTAAALVRDGASLRCLLRGSSDAGPLEVAVANVGKPDLRRLDLRRVDLRRVDLRDSDAVAAALEGCRTLLHLAAGLSGSASTLFASGAVATRKLLHAAADAGVRRVVLISSLGVYEASSLRRGETQTEQTPVDRKAAARDPYSYSKIVQERVAREVAADRDLELVVLRPGVIFGEGRPPIASRAGLQLGGLFVQMGGRQQMPYTYVENCADAIALAAVAPQAGGETINILDDDLPTASQLIRRCRSLGKRVRRLWVPGPAVPMACGLYHAYSRLSQGQLPPVLTSYRARSMWKPVRYSNARAKQLLGWQPRVGMDEAIRRTVKADLA